eukprot:CAMPEP_0173383340 /NCGR_PEP_ID=MMETSP1356-20130122/5897_1 /TAXON_ID=77927 ORGANISM="Hemiselmis virescens, Strain PCC157" /NCGR_SAMPLE_ID=MMETSP1356 /ASSEMBLY_ACC=CAM_ASM_000847 /LENGTH=65 /DNA_ID=CAMNT_0014338145 /DNA_START=72 /DNA_END=266 /DNA_ORIENTATION=+
MSLIHSFQYMFTITHLTYAINLRHTLSSLEAFCLAAGLLSSPNPQHLLYQPGTSLVQAWYKPGTS